MLRREILGFSSFLRFPANPPGSAVSPLLEVARLRRRGLIGASAFRAAMRLEEDLAAARSGTDTSAARRVALALEALGADGTAEGAAEGALVHRVVDLMFSARQSFADTARQLTREGRALRPAHAEGLMVAGLDWIDAHYCRADGRAGRFTPYQEGFRDGIRHMAERADRMAESARLPATSGETLAWFAEIGHRRLRQGHAEPDGEN